MRVKMLRTVAGPQGNWHAMGTYRVPEELPQDEAVRFVDRKLAIWLDAPEVEAAVAEEPRAENTDARPKRKRGRPPKQKEVADAD